MSRPPGSNARRRLWVPPWLGRAIESWLRRRGYELHVYPSSEDDRRATLLRSRGITLVLDVGANAGQYAQRLRDTGYRGRIISFEPLSPAFRQLEQRTKNDPRWEPRQLALAAEDGEAELNVAANSSSSSLLPMKRRHLESAPHSAYVGTETVPTARLASIWEDLDATGETIWLKLDVQGYELRVLEGAESVFDAVDAVQAEMALVPLYEADVSWRQLVDWLEARGLRLAGLEPVFTDPETGELLQADGIFIKG